MMARISNDTKPANHTATRLEAPCTSENIPACAFPDAVLTAQGPTAVPVLPECNITFSLAATTDVLFVIRGSVSLVVQPLHVGFGSAKRAQHQDFRHIVRV